jgi:hypothetical protein
MASQLERRNFSCPRHLVAWISAFQAEGVGSIPTGGAAAASSMFGGVAGLVTRADCESVSGGCDPRTSPRTESEDVLEAERIGSGFLNRERQVRLLPRTLDFE